MLRYITDKLCDFYLFLETPLKATKQYFPLAWLKTINHRTNRSTVISITEVNELLVDEVPIFEVILVVNNDVFRVICL